MNLRTPEWLLITIQAVALLTVGLVGCQQANVRHIDVARKTVWDAAISPNGEAIVILVDGEVRCFEVPSLNEKWSRRMLQTDSHQIVSFDSTGGNVLVVVLDYADRDNSTQGLLTLSAEDGRDISRMPLPQMPRILDIEGESNICVVTDYAMEFVGKIVDGQIQLLSSGMVRRVGGNAPAQTTCVGFWNDRNGTPTEINLANNSDAVLLSLALRVDGETTLDHREQNEHKVSLSLSGVTQICAAQ